MARPLRVEYPGALYLVTARTLPRQRLYRDSTELEDFLGRLPQLAEAFGAVFHAFSVLPNHYHLLVETPGGNLSRVLHRLNAGYTATVNAGRRRRGPLLQSRFRAVLTEESWLVPLSVYVHLNPTRKGLTEEPWTWPGSSARAYPPGVEEVPGLHRDRVLELAGGEEAYARKIREAMETPPRPPWKQVWRQVVLGGEDLRRRVAAALEGANPREFAGFKATPSGPSLDEVLELVSESTGLGPDEILRGKFQRLLVRKVAIYLARRFTGLTLREIGEAFGVDYTTVHMAARRLEELRRADPSVESFVSGLEQELRSRRDREGEGGPEAERKSRRRKRQVKGGGRDEKADSQLKLF